jgi:hypothetical protein
MSETTHFRFCAIPSLRSSANSRRPHFSKSPAHRPQTLGPSRSQAGDAAPTTARHSEFQILAEHIERLVPSEAVELGGVGAPGHAGLSAPRCRLWPPNSSPPEADGRRACQHDAGDRAWSGRRGAAPGQRGAARAGASKSGGTARLERYRRRRARRSARAPDRIRCGRSRRGQGVVTGAVCAPFELRARVSSKTSVRRRSISRAAARAERRNASRRPGRSC